MKITESDVLHVARLARLKLDEAEVAVFARELGAILEYMEILNNLDTAGVEPTFIVRATTNVQRHDTVVQSQGIDNCSLNAPKTVDGYFAVPKVIEQE